PAGGGTSCSVAPRGVCRLPRQRGSVVRRVEMAMDLLVNPTLEEVREREPWVYEHKKCGTRTVIDVLEVHTLFTLGGPVGLAVGAAGGAAFGWFAGGFLYGMVCG